jgi:predicted deacylase
VPGVFAGGCEATFEPGVALAQVYAAASGYPYQASFTSYTVTGDAVDWLAAQGLPAIEVELRAHDALEWEQNLAGVLAVLAYYGAGEP